MKPVSFLESVTAPSNACVVADQHLLPDHYNFMAEIANEVNKLKAGGFPCVEIKLSEVTSLREFCNNSMSFGDAVEELLKEKLDGYTGLQYHTDVRVKLFEEDTDSDVITRITTAYNDGHTLFYFYEQDVKGDKEE